MKKYLLIFVCLLFSLPSFAIKFDGIEFKGDGETFARALQAKGYTLIDKEIKDFYVIQVWRIFEKEFMGQRSRFYLFSNFGNDKIRSFEISLEASYKKELDKIYDNVLEMFINEYGKPKYSYDYQTSKKINKKYFPKDRLNHVMYHLWEVDGYKIILDCTMSDQLLGAIDIYFYVPGYDPLKP